MPANALRWDELSPERQDELIASGWHPGPPPENAERWSFYICLDCGGLREDLDGRKPHPSWPKCECVR